MKKFTEINETNKTVETSTNKKDFIKNLIEESLTIENGEIKGKESLSKTLNRILDINESKTIIKVLETVKARSFHTLNLEWINESIVNEKKKMEKTDECECEKCKKCPCECEKEDKKCEKCGKNPCECEKTNESLNEGKKIEIEVEVEIKCEKPEGEEAEIITEEEPVVVDEFIDPEEEEEGEEEEDVFIEESVNFLSDIHELSRIMESVNTLNEEHHLDNKQDQINYIMSNFTKKKVEAVVLDYISKLPDYVKTADIQKTLLNMSDDEVEKLYLDVEKIK